MHKTKVEISEDVRKAAIDHLQARLADAVDLVTQARQTRWNVKDRNIIARHDLFDDLFDKIADDGREHAELIAERIAALGGVTEGTAVERWALPRDSLDIADGTAHVEALSTTLAAFGQAARATIDAAAEMGDQVTVDVFTEVARGADKNLWMVEAMSKRTDYLRSRRSGPKATPAARPEHAGGDTRVASEPGAVAVERDGDQDAVDLSSIGSFPASDPPGWIY